MSHRPFKLLFTPSINWSRQLTQTDPAPAPDAGALYRELTALGFQCETLDPTEGWLNPFQGRDTLLQSIDPWRTLKLLTRRRDVDAVISVGEGAAFTLGLLRPFLPRRTSLFVWDPGLTEWRLRNRIITATLPRIDGVLVLGTNQINHIRQRYQCPSVPIMQIGHHIDTDFYAPLGRPPESSYVLSVGDDIGRDFPTLLQAMEGQAQRLVVKASRHPPAARMENLDLITRRLGFVELRELYANAEIVVVPTHETHNACGVSSILEASAMGKAMVVTRNEATREFIKKNETCLVVPPHDVDAMRAAIHRLRSDSKLRNTLGSNARQFAVENHRVAVFAARLSSAIWQLHAQRESAG